ncbi:MAG: transposase [Geminicoccaceae bacterium]
MIQQDAERILELREQIKMLEAKMARFADKSVIASHLALFPGFGQVCTAELAGEIGTIERFRSEASLALYLVMAALDRSSGKFHDSKPPKHVNVRAKAVMMIAIANSSRNHSAITQKNGSSVKNTIRPSVSLAENSATLSLKCSNMIDPIESILDQNSPRTS